MGVYPEGPECITGLLLSTMYMWSELSYAQVLVIR